ncbi:DUF1223 domain-containing protein [Ancylobacter lacus]|uniref:DUF1223 domain-containing protein n=1 Tax=Ancylobacter lacus TaxID=2579970 RepID=UPI001BCB4918|nr:DUF1223 domain-containing protein [Ancylobacter lacus]MBS7538341.1 DUF1223 domain-containing protein [Ancylobacter lacus]
MSAPMPRPLAPLAPLACALALVMGGSFFVAGTAAHAGDDAAASSSGGAKPVAVVELFTSQGCSSCPPADRLLGELAQRPGVIALTLAVDYWDYLGWKDTLAKHGHSMRQKSYARARGDGKLFTPQLIVNGSVMTVGNDPEAISRALARTAPLTVPVAASVEGDRVSVKVGAGLGAGEVWLCPVSRSEAVQIGRGENEGTTVDYHNVVRGWMKLGDWNGTPATFDAGLAELRGGADAVAVLVQAGTAVMPGPVLGATMAPLHPSSTSPH